MRQVLGNRGHPFTFDGHGGRNAWLAWKTKNPFSVWIFLPDSLNTHSLSLPLSLSKRRSQSRAESIPLFLQILWKFLVCLFIVVIRFAGSDYGCNLRKVVVSSEVWRFSSTRALWRNSKPQKPCSIRSAFRSCKLYAIFSTCCTPVDAVVLQLILSR
jgi:hypothetical protein